MGNGADFDTTTFHVPSDDIELTQAQYQGAVKQIPLLYFILVVNMLGICYSFWGVAPPLLSAYLPMALCALCVRRGFIGRAEQGQSQ